MLVVPVYVSHVCVSEQCVTVCALWYRICIIAGDISPIDVVTHLPVLCEDHDIPYIYVPSKEVQRQPVNHADCGTSLLLLQLQRSLMHSTHTVLPVPWCLTFYHVLYIYCQDLQCYNAHGAPTASWSRRRHVACRSWVQQDWPSGLPVVCWCFQRLWKMQLMTMRQRSFWLHMRK